MFITLGSKKVLLVHDTLCHELSCCNRLVSWSDHPVMQHSACLDPCLVASQGQEAADDVI